MKYEEIKLLNKMVDDINELKRVVTKLVELATATKPITNG